MRRTTKEKGMKLLNLYVRQDVKTIVCYYIHYRIRAYYLCVNRTSQTEIRLTIKTNALSNKYPSNPFRHKHIYTTAPKSLTRVNPFKY